MSARRPRGLGASALLLPLIAGCEEAGGVGAAVVRDSAGVTIVENPAPAALPARSVSGPVLAIGAVAGAEELELYDVAGVVRLSDGSVAVATGGNEIRWFDADGRFLRRAGGEGGGPGEFRRIRYLRVLPGDSLLVFDSGNRRVSVLDPAGRWVRAETVPLDEERPVTVAGALRDGTLLTRRAVETPSTSTPLYRIRMEFALSRAGAAVPLRAYLGPEAALHADGAGGGIGSVFISLLPFARGVHAAAGADRFFVASSDAYQVDVWDGAGRLVRIIRVDVPVTPVDETVREAWVARELERRRRSATERGQPFEQAAARRELAEQPYAPALPAFGALLATAEGGLWVKEYAMPGAEPAPERWTAFDADGRTAAAIDLPAGFTPLYVEGSLVLGVFRDSLDVPYVHGYDIGG